MLITVSPSASWTQQVCFIDADSADSAISATASEQCQMYPSCWILHLILFKPYRKQKLDWLHEMNVNKTKLSRSKYATPIDVLNHAPIGQ